LSIKKNLLNFNIITVNFVYTNLKKIYMRIRYIHFY